MFTVLDLYRTILACKCSSLPGNKNHDLLQEKLEPSDVAASQVAEDDEDDDDDDDDDYDYADDCYNYRSRSSRAKLALKKQPKISPTLYPTQKLQQLLIEQRQSMPRFRAPVHQKNVHHPKNFVPG